MGDQKQESTDEQREGGGGASSEREDPRTREPSEEEQREIEEERERRLDPDNRPDNVEVDNTDRDFDPVQGRFEDSEEDPDVGPFNEPSVEEA